MRKGGGLGRAAGIASAGGMGARASLAPLRRATLRRATLRVAVIGIGIGVTGAWPGVAHADVDLETLPPITDRHWALDLYDGAALGTVRIVGMGGAALAVAEGSAGTLSNPAAAAVRRTTSNRTWDWDFHIDALSTVYAKDVDNNGLYADDDYGVRVGTTGLSVRRKEWGAAVTFSSTTAQLADSDEGLQATATRTKLALARTFDSDEITVGLAVRFGDLAIAKHTDDGDDELFQLDGRGLEAGALWRPPGQDWRIGASASTPFTGSHVDASDCDPLDCGGYILPDRVKVPWQAAVGGAWRFAPTRWNQVVDKPFRDEHVVQVALDAVVTGRVDDGYGLDAFARHRWQRSGRHTVVSGRAGVEWEIIPGRLRLRGGSYWEPGRFDGVGGRAHVTAGFEIGFLNFRFFGRRRFRLSATGDYAARYGNAGVSLGFWH